MNIKAINFGKFSVFSIFLSAFLSTASFAQGIQENDSYSGFQVQYPKDTIPERFLFESGSKTSSGVIAIILPGDPVVLNITKDDPFTGKETYEYSTISCRFDVYLGNISNQRIMLKTDTGFIPNVVTFVLHLENGRNIGFNTWASSMLEAPKERDGRRLIDGRSSRTESFNDTKKFDSEVAAREEMFEICDISGIKGITINASDMFLFEKDREQNPIDTIFVEVFNSQPFVEAREIREEQIEESLELLPNIYSCLPVFNLSEDALNTKVKVTVSIDTNGRPISDSIRLIESSGGNEESAEEVFEAIRRGVIRCGAYGFDFPADRYEDWKTMEITLRPSDLFSK